MNNSEHILIVSSVWPEPASSAAGQRMMQLINAFRAADWKITYASTAAESEYAADLSPLDIETAHIKMNSCTFDDFITDLQPSVVLFDRFMVEEQFGWRVARCCPDAMRILDTEDLHCLRWARHKALKEGRSFNERDLPVQDDARREIASILRCDLSLIISGYEMELLKDLFKVDPALLHYLPLLVDAVDEEAIRSWPAFGERAHFMTIGNFRHAPNMDAARYLSETLWPLIYQKLPKAEMHIYGAYPSQKAHRLHQPENGFYVKGRADDAREVIRQARVCLAPLRFGAGLKGKLIEAMQCGTPSVTTAIGAEGINGDMDWPGAVADSSEALAASAVQLYTDQPAWEKAQGKAQNIINRRFAGKAFIGGVMDRVKKIYEQLEEHRARNFTGAMLMHHTMASTKYMGRWIEEKNQP